MPSVCACGDRKPPVVSVWSVMNLAYVVCDVIVAILTLIAIVGA